MTRILAAVACVACALFAAAVLVNVAFFTAPTPAAPPPIVTTTTPYPVIGSP